MVLAFYYGGYGCTLCKKRYYDYFEQILRLPCKSRLVAMSICTSQSFVGQSRERADWIHRGKKGAEVQQRSACKLNLGCCDYSVFSLVTKLKVEMHLTHF